MAGCFAAGLLLIALAIAGMMLLHEATSGSSAGGMEGIVWPG